MAKTARAKKAEVKPSKMDLAAPVSGRVQIQYVCLIETNAKRGRFSGKTPEQLNVDVSVSTTADKEKPGVLVNPRFILVGRFADDTTGEDALRVEAAYALRYNVETLDGLTAENLDAFGELNGVYNAWPYWREYVQSVTTRMGLPALTVPVLQPAKVAPEPRKPRQ